MYTPKTSFIGINTILGAMKVLLDEMYDGLDDELGKMGHEAYSVKKLKKENEKLGHDFNVINYARDHGLALITNDGENGRACKANNLPCVFINRDAILERIILPELKKLENTK
jgi:predicted nuclease of predicted toxin-antitoxin system